MLEILRDLRFGTRLLAKSPVFTITAALLLAIGISANTLIFSVVNALLLRPLPVSHPENLVRVVEVHPNEFITWDLPYNFCEGAAATDADFSEVLCQGEADVSYRDGLTTERVRLHLVSPNFFVSLGVSPYLGRVLSAGDESGRAMNAVASYEFWRSKLHRDAAVVGRKIVLGGHPFTIVGVSPEEFNGLTVDTSPDLRVPASVDRYLVNPQGDMSPTARPLFGQVFGRLRAGVAFGQANARADRLLNKRLQEEDEKIYPPAKGMASTDDAVRSHLQLESIANGVSTLRAQFSRSLKLLMAGVALLLLMACANVAGLLLARSAGRSHEIGIRLALGASPGRIVRQLLTEGLLLSLLGGAAGMLLTSACLPLLMRGLPPIRDRGAVLQPLAVHMAIDLRVLVFAIGTTALTAILFALSPALRCARTQVANTLRGTRTVTRRAWAGNLIVMAQVGICTLILMGTILLIQTLSRMNRMNAGFDRDRVVTFTIDPDLRGHQPEQFRILSKTLLEKSKFLPGVTAASIAARGLMRGTGQKVTVGAAGSRIQASDFLNSSLNEVTPGYFETMGMHLISGRNFTWFDRSSAKPRKVIVNRAFARRFFPGKNPVGERFGFAGAGGIAEAANEIVGVVSDAKYRSLREPIPPTVYNPMVDGFDDAFILHLRTAGKPESIITPVRELLRSLGPELLVIEARTLHDEVEASLWQERLLAVLSTIFGAIAALLASIGLYGALDYAVKARTREIGVRLALGAPPGGIVKLFSREAAVLTSGGMLLGLGAYAAVSTYLHKALFELRPFEPSALALVVLGVAAIAAIATTPATFRAARTNPASALRSD